MRAVTGAGRGAVASWPLLAALVLAQIGYPLTDGVARARLTVVTVLLGYLLSVSHALLSRGPRTALALIVVTTGGGLAVEAIGLGTGFPFGTYDYSGALGPKLAGVPLVIPLAWTWMAWPAWLAAVRLTGHLASGARRAVTRVLIAAVGLAAWDVFLDPQMVGEGYWTWLDPGPALPGVPGVPISNYLGWLLFALILMAALGPATGPAGSTGSAVPAVPAGSAGSAVPGGAATGSEPDDRPMYALYLWTYASSVLAHAAFLGLPASAGWGALAMGLVAVPLGLALLGRSPSADRASPALTARC
nr:carotenoid biosynthesis protein [Micromonospora sp. DSM 115978]